MAKAKAAKTKAKAKAKAMKPKATKPKATMPKANATKPKATRPKAKANANAKPGPTAKTGSPAGGRIERALATLRTWAAAGHGTIDVSKPKADAKARLKAPVPEWGKVTWSLPPSYAAFLALASRMEIKWGEDIGHDEFVILDPGEMSETGGVVYMPADVSRDEGVYLSTNHLVPFASAGNDECAFCFDVTAPSANGEYPVYFHHQDEPRARIKATGVWEAPESATPDFPDFASWLEWVASELAAGRELQHSYPSAFYNMPGRKR